MKKTQSTISIGNLRFRPFNHLQLKEIYAADLKNDTLFYAEKLNADFNLFKLFRNQLVIHSIEIDNFDFRFSKDSIETPFNFQFLIDAFASDTTQKTDSSNLQLTINSIMLKNGRLRYDVFSEPFQAPDLFDFNHIDVRNLQFNAKLLYNNIEDWSSSIDHFSFDEKSGFALKQMDLQIKTREKQLQVAHFYISFPHSEANIKDAKIDYTGYELEEMLSGATYSIPFISGKFDLSDFSCFYPELANYADTVICSGEVKGRFPEISVPRFELDYGKQLQLKLNAGITDYNIWETSAFNLNIEKCLIDPELFEIPFHTDLTAITGKINGSLPDLTVALIAASKQGDLELSGTGGYDASSENIDFDMNLKSAEYDIKNLLSDSAFGNVSFSLSAKGTVSAFDKIDVKANAEIRKFDYLGYSYNDITASASYVNDSLSFNLNSEDAHLPLKVEVKAGLDKKNAFATLYAKLDGAHPDVLNLLPQYPGTELSGIINADIEGFDPELMSASVSIDDLYWITSTENFNGSPLTISYIADANGQKQINLRSPVLSVRGKGNLTYDGIMRSFKQAFPVFFSSNNYNIKNKIPNQENFDFIIGIRQANAIARLLGMEASIPDSALFVGKYNKEDEELNLDLTAFCIFTRADTARIQLNLSNAQNNLVVGLDLKNKSNLYDLDGNILSTIEFIKNPKGAKPDMNITFRPGSLTLNGTSFRISPARIAITDGKYEISNFALRHSTSEYIRVNGTISDDTGDSLQIDINRFEIGTILSAMKNKIPLSGIASGDITFSQLTTNPLILSRNFVIDDLVFDENRLGNLQLRSGWSSERQGLALRATWSPPNLTESVVSGFILPKRDSLALTADIQGIQLKWLSGYLPDTFSELDGELGAHIKANGKITDPVLSGTIYLNKANAGIKMLNTRYHISDSIHIDNEQIVFNNCIIYDETNRNAKINGSIRHRNFSELDPRLSIDFNQFLVLNNSEQTDSLFYGNIRANGNLTLQSQNREWLLQGKLSNGKANKIMINFPETALEAERYNWLTFVNTQRQDSITDKTEQKASEPADFSFPLKLQITLSVDPDLSVGAIINPDTKDAATVTGHGLLDFSYNLANPVPRLLGSYVVEDGSCSLSILNIAKRTFSIQEGGKLNFQGDPMNTTFDLSAIYNVRTYLTSLDPSFATILTSSKIPVNAILSAKGKLDDMQLQYRIELPNQTDEIQRKLDGLLYTDDIKIREIAYLLAFSTFMPINSNSMNTGNSSIWTSLASSSITSQLNNLLSGVLSDNWTIGTDLHSNDSNFSDIDMDLNISTRIFNDRLTLNGTVGYHNSMNQINNFTGDFDLEYKLTSSGNLLLQFYNVTNNQYYDRSRSPLTQGAGIVYKKEGRTFRQLFKSSRAKN